MRNTLAALLLALSAFGGLAHAQTQTSPVAAPFEIHSGHIYIDAMINDQGPFHLLFDTGAVNVLTPGAAQRLGLVVDNNVSAQGTGGVQAGLKPGDVILAVDGTPCAGMSSDHLKALFKGPVGTRLNLTLDGAKGEVTLTLAEL